MSILDKYIKDGELDEDKIIEDLTMKIIKMQLQHERGIKLMNKKIKDKKDIEIIIEIIFELFNKLSETYDDYAKKLKELN